MAMPRIVILNWFPPARVQWPSPALSVLTSTLKQKEVPVKTVYWNILLEELLAGYLFENETTHLQEAGVLSLFYAYIAVEDEDPQLIAQQESLLRSKKPQHSILGFDFRDHISKYHLALKARIREIVHSQPTDNLFYGMSLHLFQWVAASVIAKEIKSIQPQATIAVGGIGNIRMAEAYLRNFPQFDLAMWGEGEDSIVKLSIALQKQQGLEEVPHIVFRQGEALCRGKGKYAYPTLDKDLIFNFQDYFSAISEKSGIDIVLPLEQSRGCHWNRCHFCFLNEGYRYRLKSASDLSWEIVHYIKTYNVYKFSFLDNDIIGKSLDNFQDLLSELLYIKEEYPSFCIELAEIITRGITRSVIRDMSLAGFKHVQIGYESASDTLLNKIDKKNTFASNLLFIKWAFFYHISLGGVNIIRGLLEETESDILEATENLSFLRFFLSHPSCQHSMSALAISASSRYYRMLNIETLDYDMYIDTLKENLPSNYIRQEDWFHIYQLISLKQSNSWKSFHEVERFILERQFTYRLTRHQDTILYQEFIDNQEIIAISFSVNDIEWQILCFANNEVKHISELTLQLGLSEPKAIDLIHNLSSARLLYYSEVHQELVSVINTELVL